MYMSILNFSMEREPLRASALHSAAAAAAAATIPAVRSIPYHSVFSVEIHRWCRYLA